MADQGAELDSASVIVAGGGPSGCAATVFIAWYGLDIVVFDRGSVALRRCAYPGNYLGFPVGVGVDTLTALIHEHLVEVGADYVTDMIASVERPGGESEVVTVSEGESGVSDAGARYFVVHAQGGHRVETDYAAIAAWHDGDYPRGLDGDGAMFEECDRHGEVYKRSDSGYADDDGWTPVDGLYVIASSGDRNAQVDVAVRQGGHVARCLIEDRRRECGFSSDLMAHHDWLQAGTEFHGEWGDRGRWCEWFDGGVSDDVDPDSERPAEPRESYIGRAFGTRRTDYEVEATEPCGIRRLVETTGTERVLDTLPDETPADYFGERELGDVEQ